jgi:pimeloyl-ACP methyl ester carboxylesterase
MLLLLFALSAADPGPLAGVWEGSLKAGAIPLKLQFTLVTLPDGSLGGHLVSLDQGDAKVPFKEATLTDGKLVLKLPAAGATFTGTVTADGQTIKGDWKQGGNTLPLTLTRVEKPTTRNRPQLPKPPFPYSAEEVTFVNPAGGHKLAGTLTKPKGDGPFTAVVLVSGSGPQDRDESLLGHKPFLVLADHLTRAGIAVLRYDDRGVGKSGGTFAGCTSADFATDAHAAVKFLLGRPDIDRKRVGICGHSEGGLIGPMVAADHPADIAFVVMLAGPGLPGDELLQLQVRDVYRAEGKDDKQIAALQTLNRLSIAAMKKPWTDPRPVLAAAVGGVAGGAADKWRPKPPGDPWMRFFVSHDPRPTLAKVKCPVLALNGEKDAQVAAPENLKAIKAACPQADCRELPGLNHLFQPCKTGGVAEYAEIETTFDPAALAIIAEWVTGLGAR